MKFADISYSNRKEDFGIHGIFLKFPDSIIHQYLLRYRPFSIQEMTLANAEGYKVKFYQHDQQQKQKKQMEKLLSLLQQKEVDVLLTHTDMVLPYGIDISYGNMINALFVLETAKKAIKRQQKTLQESKFLIIDGGNSMTDLVLDIIYPHVNYLSIYTNREQYFYEKAEKIYEEYGLRLDFFSGVKNKQFELFHIILNCSSDMDNYDYKIQKNAFFFDMVQNNQKMNRLMSRRNDLLLCNGLLLKWGEKSYSSQQIETILRVTEPSFHHFLCYDNRKQELQEITNLLQQKKINVTAFTCFEKRV